MNRNKDYFEADEQLTSVVAGGGEVTITATELFSEETFINIQTF